LLKFIFINTVVILFIVIPILFMVIVISVSILLYLFVNLFINRSYWMNVSL